MYLHHKELEEVHPVLQCGCGEAVACAMGDDTSMLQYDWRYVCATK